MQIQVAPSDTNAGYTVSSAADNLPPDVSQTLFLQLAYHYRLRARQITATDRAKLIAAVRLIQKLPSAEQLRLLSNAIDSDREAATKRPERPIILDQQEHESWIKEKVSEAYSWVRDLRRLGIATASSYIFASRRSAAQPPRDWANEVLHYHYCKPLTVQTSVLRHVENLDNTFVQLPDRRWYIKYRGEAVPPLSDNIGGLRCIHSLIKSNYLGDIVVREKEAASSCLSMPPSSALSDQKATHQLSHEIESSGFEPKSFSLKSFCAFRGGEDLGRNRKLRDRRSNPEAKQIVRAIQEIASHNSRVATILNSAISADKLGVLGFADTDRDLWVTDLGQISCDASLEKTRTGWLVKIPGSEDSIEVPARQIGMEYIARALQLTGVSIPVGLLANPALLNALTDCPPYQKLFKPAVQRLIKLDGRFEFDPGTCAIIEAVNSARDYCSRYYEVTHEIAKESLLAKYITTGFVSLTPDGLNGVLYLLKKRLAASVMDGSDTRELASLVRNIDKAVKFVSRYEDLAGQIEPESNAAADKVQKAVRRATDYFWDMGEHSLGQ